MDRLQFGTTARNRARRKKRIRRLSIVAWVLSTAALAGGPIYGLNQAKVIDLGGRLPDPAPSASAASTAIAIDSGRHLVDEKANRVEKSKKITKKRRSSEPAGDYSGSITDIIHAAAAEFGVDGDYLVSIAECESGLDPRAYNSAGYHGLFQYDESTWAAYGEGDIWDPVAQAKATAKLIADGQSSRWPNCA